MKQVIDLGPCILLSSALIEPVIENTIMNSSENIFDPSERTLRQFSAMWILFFALFATRQGLHGHYAIMALLIVLSAVGPFGVLRPRIMRPIFVGWMRLVYPIGWTVSRITLGIVFYGVFTPVSAIFRLGDRDALGLKQDESQASCWRSKPQSTGKTQYQRQF
jgi:hypothetical protein